MMENRMLPMYVFTKRRLLALLLPCAMIGAGAALQSCSGEISLEGQLVNMYGGAGRANNYEGYEALASRGFSAENLAAKDSSGAAVPPLVLGTGRVILATVEGSVICADRTRPVWEKKLENEAVVTAGMCADTKQNIYVLTSAGEVLSFDTEGKRRWKASLTESGRKTYSDLLAVSDGVIAAASDGTIAKFGFDGSFHWKRKQALSPSRSFAADADGNIVVGMTNNAIGISDSLLMLNPKGEEMWERPFEYMHIIRTPVVHGKTILLCGIKATNAERVSVLHAIDPSGRVMWSRELAYVPRGISVGSDGKIYLAGSNTGIGEAMSAVTCISAGGDTEWNEYFEMDIPTSVIVGESLVMCTGIKGSAVGIYFLEKSGKLDNLVSVSDAPLFNHMASVLPDGTVIFAQTGRAGLVRTKASSLPF